MKYIIIAVLLLSSLWASSDHKAKVLETMDSAGYTYIKVQEDKDIYWIAMTQRKLSVGETISYTEQAWMKDFRSKTLQRNFEKILFASDIQTQIRVNKLTKVKTNIMESSYKEKGAISIAELFKNRKKYDKKTITIKGKVTKTSLGIIKRNWVHLSDGSRFQNTDDIVFTTTGDVPSVGDIASATGTVTLDKDFGYGYFYPVILENSSF